MQQKKVDWLTVLPYIGELVIKNFRVQSIERVELLLLLVEQFLFVA